MVVVKVIETAPSGHTLSWRNMDEPDDHTARIAVGVLADYYAEKLKLNGDRGSLIEIQVRVQALLFEPIA